jgi:kynurenine formamidase
MRRRVTVVAGGAILGVVVAVLGVRTHGQANAVASTATPADYLRWRNELKNWGRWGADDQRGASNLIGVSKVQSAARLVKSGIVVSLAHALPQKAEADVPAASIFRRTTNLVSDTITVDSYQTSYHGLVVAHMDAFCHFVFDGQMFNGVPVAGNITTEAGCHKGDIMAWRDGIVTRAVIYDIPQLKGVPWLEPGTPVTRADLEAWESKSGVKAGPGDVMMLYVGRWKRRAAEGPWAGTVPGFYADTIPLIKQRDVAFLAHDFNIDWAPRPGWGQTEGIPGMPIHQAMLNWLGVGIVENLDLEKAIETARRLKRYEFMLTVAPLPVEGGTGSPVNPLAVF